MRDAFFEELLKIFRLDPNCVFVAADNGAPTLDTFARELPRQYVTVGIAEQEAVGLAAGMALEGWRPWVYAIAPFVTARVYEFAKLDICAMSLPVTLLGVGAGYSYDIMGPTHHTTEDLALMRSLPGMTVWSPADGRTAGALAKHVYRARTPAYIRFDRAGLPDLGGEVNLESGYRLHRPGPGPGCRCIVTTGVMTHLALQAFGGTDTVVEVLRLPISREVASLVNGFPEVVTLEEHLLPGGLGAAVLEALSDLGDWPTPAVLRLGADGYVFDLGGREEIWRRLGLGVADIKRRVTEWSQDEPGRPDERPL